MAVKVSYKYGKKQTYLSLAERNPYALYFCTDTKELFKGDDLYSDGLRTVPNYDSLPAFSEAADGILYLCKDTGNGYVLNESRDDWDIVVRGIDNETIGVNQQGLMAVKIIPITSVNGLEERLTAIEESVVAGAPIATEETPGLVKASTEIAVAQDGTMSISSVSQEKVLGLSEKLSSIEQSINDSLSAITWEEMEAPATNVDLNAPGVNVTEILNNAESGDTLKFTDGTIDSSLTIDKSLTLNGAIAGIAQNYDQEV